MEKIRVANKINDNWVVNQWIKKAILLSFRINKMEIMKGPYTTWYDKVPEKTVMERERLEKKQHTVTYLMELLEREHTLLKMLF